MLKSNASMTMEINGLVHYLESQFMALEEQVLSEDARQSILWRKPLKFSTLMREEIPYGKKQNKKLRISWMMHNEFSIKLRKGNHLFIHFH